MKTFHYLLMRIKNTRGTVIVYVGIAIFALLGITALAIDVGYVMGTRNEIQNVADASALAATRQLGVIYELMSSQAQQSYVCQGSDRTAIEQAALDVAFSNTAAQQNIVLNTADIVIGKWNAQTKIFTGPDYNQPDAVKVTALRSGAPTFFAKIFGSNAFAVSGIATAALTGPSTVEEGGLPVPIGISYYWFENKAEVNYCNQDITFSPTNQPSSCAGWHVFDTLPFSDSKLVDIIDDIRTGDYSSPDGTAGELAFNFGGGDMSQQTFGAMQALWNAKLNVYSPPGINATQDCTLVNPCNAWMATVPVYDWDTCANPNPRGPAKAITIIGFATVVIKEVVDAGGGPNGKIIRGYVECNLVKPSRGGGAETGTLGSIPGLVQ